MISMPQTEAISNFKNACDDVLVKRRKGSVLLLQRSQAAAVLVDPAMWNQDVEEMRELRLMLLYYQRRDAAQQNPDLLVSHEELEEQLAEKAQAIQKLAAWWGKANNARVLSELNAVGSVCCRVT